MQPSLLPGRGQPYEQAKMSTTARPLSHVSDTVYTEFEDDESDVEQDSMVSSNQSNLDDRRRSDTTVSSYNEAVTPGTEHGQFEIIFKPVEGPQGPHLLRSSRGSADLMFDFALQMSPLEVKKTPSPKPVTTQGRPQTPILRPSTALSQRPSPPRSIKRTITPFMADLPGLPSNVHDWTAIDVADWLYNATVDMSVIDSFRQNDITGTVLLDMDFDDLKELGIQSFGKRHQVWSTIEDLRYGLSVPSPVATPFQDVQADTPASEDDFEFPRSACSSTSIEDLTPVESVSRSRRKRSRRGRRHQRSHTVDEIDLGRLSLLAIEEKLPQEHVCDKGHECKQWKKWNKRVQKAKAFNDRIHSNKDGCSVTYTTSERNSDVAKPCGQLRAPQERHVDRPVSEGLVSVIASSDVLGHSDTPDFASTLQQVTKRDPQENIQQFLYLQHMSSPMEAPAPPSLTPVEPDEPAQPVLRSHNFHEESSFEMFPADYHRPVGMSQTLAPLGHLKHLPRLAIPRAATASPSLVRRQAAYRSPVCPQSHGQDFLSPGRTRMVSPLSTVRAGTPASEMNVPLTAPPLCPYQRDHSYSVPPNMHYRDLCPTSARPSSTRPEHHRRPSFAMPPLAEVLETHSQYNLSPDRATHQHRSPVPRRASDTTPTAQDAPSSQRKDSLFRTPQEVYGPDCTHAGYMKKRRTRLLRHEWNQAHFRLHGSGKLDMHSSAVVGVPATDSIDVHDYTVNAYSGASNSKLTAALRSLNLQRLRDDGKEGSSAAAGAGVGAATGGGGGVAFAFQLVPDAGAAKSAAAGSTKRMALPGLTGGKTHHFAVGDREERCDWMREVMLAKAAAQKARGTGRRSEEGKKAGTVGART